MSTRWFPVRWRRRPARATRSALGRRLAAARIRGSGVARALKSGGVRGFLRGAWERWPRSQDETKDRFWRPGWPGHPVPFLAFLNIHCIGLTAVLPRASQFARHPSMDRSRARVVQAKRRARGPHRHRFVCRDNGTRMQTGSAACFGPMTGDQHPR